jgi:hypothetical protein
MAGMGMRIVAQPMIRRAIQRNTRTEGFTKPAVRGL